MRLLLLLWLCCLAMPVRADGDFLQHCLEKAERRQQATIDLAKDCPKLLRELQQQGMTASSEPPLAEKVTVAQLQFLLRSRQAVRPFGTLSQDGLEQLLAEILQPEAPNPEAAWWDALTAWLEKLKSGDYEAQYQWLLSFLRSITPSEEVALAFLYGALALMVIASAWVVIMELYYAGVFGKWPSLRRYSAASSKAPELPQQVAVLDAQSSSTVPQRQMAALLDNVIAGLAANGTLPADATLTHRQLARYIGEHAPQAAEAFTRLVRRAEPVLYGKRSASEEMLRACYDDADLLLGNVNA